MCLAQAKRAWKPKPVKSGLEKIQVELNRLSSGLNKRKCKTKQEVQKTTWLNPEAAGSSDLFRVELKGEEGNFSLFQEIDQKKLEETQILEGVYVVKTNLPKKKYTLDDVLALYKKQIRIEDRIADIKGPLHVAPIYLKKPRRIASLFSIIMQALKIYTLIEREVHLAVQKRGEKIPILPENHKSKRPKGVFYPENF